ncbi:MAG TPA: thioredoxin [bacterium]|nr:thioredoxin [bacterium]HNW82766.1 thioredoxin [bacterium]HNZ53206.1 thioredoxin [bacterium]HOG42878.1 thioredoxin [bacterium]HPA56189.1 thioredoxin [bacterium]
MLSVSLSNFASEVEEFKGLVIIDFWAPWCGPCRMLGPIFEELAGDYADNSSIKFVKINTDEDPDLARKFQIRGIPTIKFIKNGKEVDQQVGAVPKEVIKEFISKHI